MGLFFIVYIYEMFYNWAADGCMDLPVYLLAMHASMDHCSKIIIIGELSLTATIVIVWTNSTRKNR